MAEAAKKIGVAPSKESTTSASDLLKQRESKELVIALCGSVGSGIKAVVKSLRIQLEANEYHVEHIRLSDLMQELTRESGDVQLAEIVSGINPRCEYSRIEGLQSLGNQLRKEFAGDICAQLAIRYISKWRHPDDTPQNIKQNASEKKTAFIIDQLKHPKEYEMLKKIYRDTLYLVGLLTTDTEKLKRLETRKISSDDAAKVISADRKQDFSHGQQLEKTLVFADYFLAFSSDHLPKIENNVKRFIDLIHGVNGITPTKQEVGMYAAYSASLQSACLSRQVGAAISDEKGIIIATGKNDVPEFGGGLYSADSSRDLRCIHKGGKCYNTHEINSLKFDIERILIEELTLEPDLASKITDIISKQTKVGSLIEFSRSIHAEMDAIVSLARSPSATTKGKHLYTTTYPCHNCARHIVAAGIEKVIYIEPYAKSLATKLHDDSLTDSDESCGKVAISPFEGVSPNKYQTFFVADGQRKNSDTGEAIRHATKDLLHISRIIVSGYPDTESKITETLQQLIERKSQPVLAASVDIENIDGFEEGQND
jgi:deoxycytidylate deaminase